MPRKCLEPRFPVLKKAVKEGGIPFDADEVTLYLGREDFLASERGEMGRLTEWLFSVLQ